MADLVKYIYGTEAQILSLEPEDGNWIEKAFYYPSDKNYFYQALNGVMKKYGAGDATQLGVGITLDGKIIGGVKTIILPNEVLDIPENYDYNTYSLYVEGIIVNDGQINIM
jgi:hypothetical protein